MTSETEPSNGRPAIPDGEIIERFGGIRPMASKLGVAVTTVQGWKERGHIPKGRYAQIIQAAAAHGIDIGVAAPTPTPVPAPVQAAPKVEPEPAAVEVEEEAPVAKEPEPTSEPVPMPEPKPEPLPETAPAEQTKPAIAQTGAPLRRTGGVSWFALIVVIVALGGAILTGPLWQTRLYPGGGNYTVSDDTARLDEITASLAAAESAMAALRRDLDASEREIAGRVGALEAGGGESGAAYATQLAAIERGMKDIADGLATLNSGLSDIDSRIAALEGSEGELRESVKTGRDAVGAALDGLKSQVGEIGRSARGLEDSLASLGGSMGDLDGRVTELETRPLQTGEKIAAMALAVGQVEAALNSGKPYRAALKRLEDLGRDDPLISESEAIAALSPGAFYGIPDRLVLRRKFAELAPEIDRALSGAEDGNWLDSIWNSLAGLVTIRRIDGGDLGPIGQAEQALEQGDLGGATAAFEGRGSLGEEGDAWLDLVKARIDAEREIEALYGQIIAPLAGKSGRAGAVDQ